VTQCHTDSVAWNETFLLQVRRLTFLPRGFSEAKFLPPDDLNWNLTPEEVALSDLIFSAETSPV